MSNYKIQGQTLTDIADAIRIKKYGINPLEVKEEFLDGINDIPITFSPINKGLTKLTIVDIEVYEGANESEWFTFQNLYGTVNQVVYGLPELPYTIEFSDYDLYVSASSGTYVKLHYILVEADADYTVKAEDMATQINALPAAPGIDELTFKGDISNSFSNNNWNWVIDKYGDLITTKDLSNCLNAFYGSSELKRIPFQFNFITNGAAINFGYMFYGCSKLEEVPDLIKNTSNNYADFNYVFYNCKELKKIGKISGFYPSAMEQLFSSCYKLRELPVIENMNYDRIHTYNYANLGNMFKDCYSLRKIPESFIKELYNPSTSSYSGFFYNTFSSCYTLNEISGLVGCPEGTAWTSNMFSGTFDFCSHLKRLVFATNDDGTPLIRNWKNQTIDLTRYVGYASAERNLLNHNSGLTSDGWFNPIDEYPTYPEGDDWWSTSARYSRYALPSIIETINSLPDCSSSGGTNTIKFKKSAGNGFHVKQGSSVYVPQCASQLTEEQIAVAAAKGWTVTLVD